MLGAPDSKSPRSISEHARRGGTNACWVETNRRAAAHRRRAIGFEPAGYAALKLQMLGATAIERKRELNIKFSPNATLKFTIKIASAEGILETLRDLLEELEAQEAACSLH
jgi:hypothetical protein